MAPFFFPVIHHNSRVVFVDLEVAANDSSSIIENYH